VRITGFCSLEYRLVLKECLLKRLGHIIGLTGQADVVIDNGPMEDIVDGHDEEESVFVCNIAILDVCCDFN